MGLRASLFIVIRKVSLKFDCISMLHVCVYSISKAGFMSFSFVQENAELDPSHTGPPALLLPGQGEPGESNPTQTPLSAGVRRKRLSLWGTGVLEIKPTSDSRHFLLLVGKHNLQLVRCCLRCRLLITNFRLLQGDRWYNCNGSTF